MNKTSLPKAFASFVLFNKNEQQLSDTRRFTAKTKALTSVVFLGAIAVETAAYCWGLSSSSNLFQSAASYSGDGNLLNASAGLVSLLALTAIQVKMLTGPLTRCARLGIHVAFAHPNKAM